MDKIPGEELITEGIKAVGKEVYADVRPPVEAAGHALGTLMNVFNLLLAPLERAQIRSQDKTDRLRQKLAEGFEEIPPERRVEPPLEIIGPALETLKYVEDETLQDMFANLLIAAMDRETQGQTHKAFVKIIEELSSYDAWLLKKIYEDESHIAIKHDEILFQEPYKDLSSFIPFSVIRATCELEENVIGDAERSMDNLVRLRLIELMRVNDMYIKLAVLDEKAQKKYFLGTLKKHRAEHIEFIELLRESYGYWEDGCVPLDEFISSLETSVIRLSAFGLDFCTACIPKS